MTALTTLRSLVIAQIPLASDPLLDRTLVEVARDFCEKTRAYRTTQTATVTADTLEVTLTPPADGELVDIIKSTLDGLPLTKKTHEQLDEIDPEWRTDPQSSYYITLGDSANEVLVAPLSSTTYASGLSVRCAWKPALGATTLDAVIVSKYSDALIAGALSKLFIIPGESFTDPERSNYYGTVYANARDEAKQAASDGRMKGVVRKIKYGGL